MRPVLSAEEDPFEFSSKENYELSTLFSIMNHDVGHLHTDKGLLPVPTTNRDITKSQIHTSEDRAEGTCAHKVPPARHLQSACGDIKAEKWV